MNVCVNVYTYNMNELIIVIISNYHLCEMKKKEKNMPSDEINNNFKPNSRVPKANLYMRRKLSGLKERISVTSASC